MSEFVLRLVYSDHDIRKLRLPQKPATVDELKTFVKNTLSMTCDFTLLYEDKDFSNQLFTLSDMNDLSHCGTVQIVEIVVEQQLEPSMSQPDKEHDVTSHTTSPCSSNLRITSGWPKVYAVPDFDYDIELMLKAGMEDYESTGKLCTLNKSAKGAILKKLAVDIFSIKSYPTEEECGMVAKSLVSKFPCLRDPGTASGSCGWRNSIVFKMGNYRNDIRKAGGSEVSINSGRRSCHRHDLPGGHKGIQKARRAEANYLPDLPSGENNESQEELRLQISQEFEKAQHNRVKIHEQMMQSFAYRRQNIVTKPVRISEMMSTWPALFTQAEVCCRSVQ